MDGGYETHHGEQNRYDGRAIGERGSDGGRNPSTAAGTERETLTETGKTSRSGRST